MKPDYKKWAEALESGKYKQGRIFLRDKNNNYCCLGVLCEISKLNKELHIDSSGKEVYLYYTEDARPSDVNVCGVGGLPIGCLPDNLFGELGVLGKLKLYISFDNEPNSIIDTFAGLNDSNVSFRDIARIIRIQFLGEDLPYPEGLHVNEKSIN